ncbi:aldo/keto reductase [Streptosporangium roseum]|uniref:aldo/keto reductase n=1 Tax=Streptosporangium roseum TaxID=2001 RepID=UPI00332B9B37
MYEHADFDVVDMVRAVADERGLPPAQLALAWLLGRSGVSAPVVGATKVGHLDDAIAAVDVSLSGEETARLEAPYRPHQIPRPPSPHARATSSGVVYEYPVPGLGPKVRPGPGGGVGVVRRQPARLRTWWKVKSAARGGGRGPALSCGSVPGGRSKA